MKQIETFGQRLFKAMKNKNINSKEIENITGINSSLIYRYQKDIVTPKAERISVLAKALNVNKLWLIGYDVSDEIQTEITIDLKQKIEYILNNLSTSELKKVHMFLITFMCPGK